MAQITTDISRALNDLKQGKPVAIPTETVYGLAAVIDNDSAIKAVFALKNRPLDHPLIVHVAQNWELHALVEYIPDYAHQLMKKFWPGPLTLVFPCKSSLNPLITGGQTTVAIRCPAHPVAQQLIKQLETPVVAPSANPYGKISPTTALHVQHSFSQADLIILEGGRCQVGIESTILDVTQPDSYSILRHGIIDESAIAQVIKTPCSHKVNPLRAPGKLETHYQPQKALYYFSDANTLLQFCQEHADKVYVLAKQKPEDVSTDLFHSLSDNPHRVAFELFFQLRQADDSKAKFIAIELPPENKAWLGLRERILKAGRPY